LSEDIPGWLVANDGTLTVALDITLNEQLKQEGMARELINRIQNIRKDSGFEVTDKINIEIVKLSEIEGAILTFGDYIAQQTLAQNIKLVNHIQHLAVIDVEIDETLTVQILVQKI
jgi:isoleucyl-tRNA synthetase